MSSKTVRKNVLRGKILYALSTHSNSCFAPADVTQMVNDLKQKSVSNSRVPNKFQNIDHNVSTVSGSLQRFFEGGFVEKIGRGRQVQYKISVSGEECLQESYLADEGYKSHFGLS